MAAGGGEREQPRCSLRQDARLGDLLARRAAQQFLRWCMRTGNMPRLSLPVISTRNPAPLDRHRRLTLIRRAITDEQIPAMDRVAALLLLLYAQPITRIVRLTLDDITVHDGQVLLRLGDPPTPGARAVRHDPARLHHSPAERQDRHHPRQPLAVPRPPGRPAAVAALGVVRRGPGNGRLVRARGRRLPAAGGCALRRIRERP